MALGSDPETRGRTSLTNAPFIHSRLVEDLVTWESDGGDQIVALDLNESEGRSRFCCDDAGGGQQNYLGDRWKGELKVEGNKLFIGKVCGWFAENRDNGGQSRSPTIGSTSSRSRSSLR